MLDIEKKITIVMDTVYKICLALVIIVDIEGYDYDFSDEVAIAKEYIEKYERDHEEDNG